MARYGAQHKQETRQRILQAAGRRLKQDGIDGSGVAALMSDAGLTNGAFYAHFASKDDLVATVIADQLSEQHARLTPPAPGRAGLEQVIRAYLSVEHRDDPGHGCPSAALVDEIGRCAGPIKQAYTDGMLDLLDDIATRVQPEDPQSARMRLLGVLASMVGTLQISRAMADEQLADAVLEQGIHNALALLDADQPS